MHCYRGIGLNSSFSSVRQNNVSMWPNEVITAALRYMYADTPAYRKACLMISSITYNVSFELVANSYIRGSSARTVHVFTKWNGKFNFLPKASLNFTGFSFADISISLLIISISMQASSGLVLLSTNSSNLWGS